MRKIFNEIKEKRSFLCIGLDSDISKIPKHLLRYKDPIFEFNRLIVEATKDLCIAYKANLAFYEALGSPGWQSLEKTLKIIPENIFSIADAKRGDIGNTSSLYARTFFKNMDFDAVTVAPYMGADSVKPFLEFKNKFVIVLALTSNKGASDFQTLELASGEMLFEKVLRTSVTWGKPANMMFVVGATQASSIKKVRNIVPDHFLLVPGVGAQGGSLQEVCAFGMNSKCGLLVNASRSIIYAGDGKDFDKKAREEAQKIQSEMNVLLRKGGL